ncbi:hypothetical protein EMCRGX_G027568 [Ephydatia muelleri]|eukprot:Em0020g1013a
MAMTNGCISAIHNHTTNGEDSIIHHTDSRLHVLPGFCPASAGRRRMVLGCGSNVVNRIYRVGVVPRAGERGYLRSVSKTYDKCLIGGVTLNHLSWAALGGVATGLLAFQGTDECGLLIRAGLKELGVWTDFVQVNSSYSTAQCLVFVQDDGDKSTMQGPSSTAFINAQAVNEYFDDVIQQHASMVTTDISQVPLSGVLALLNSARRAGVLAILDLDIPPSVAVQEAELGSWEELLECVRGADVLKVSKASVVELSQRLGNRDAESSCFAVLARFLAKECGSKLVCITTGAEGCILATSELLVEVPAHEVPVVVDIMGAGDAFVGGLIFGIQKTGIPDTIKELRELGITANAFSAACVCSVGTVPVGDSRDRLQSFLPDTALGRVPRGRNGVDGFVSSLANDLQALTHLFSKVRITKEGADEVISLIDSSRGHLFTSGIGKSGSVAERFAASLSSVEVPSSYVNACHWTHGDLGKAQRERDIVVFISHSGSTQECITAAKHLVAKGVTTVGLTGIKDSPLSRVCTLCIYYDSEFLNEPFGCMPTSSVILQEALCNAIVIELMHLREVNRSTFLSNHPGGHIGTRHISS